MAPRPMRPPVQPPTHLGSFPPGCRRAHLGKAPGAGGAQPCPPHPLHTHTNPLPGRTGQGHPRDPHPEAGFVGPVVGAGAGSACVPKGTFFSPHCWSRDTRRPPPILLFSGGWGSGPGPSLSGSTTIAPRPGPVRTVLASPPAPGAECGAGAGVGVGWGADFCRSDTVFSAPGRSGLPGEPSCPGRGSSRSGSERAGWELRDCFGM